MNAIMTAGGNMRRTLLPFPQYMKSELGHPGQMIRGEWSVLLRFDVRIRVVSQLPHVTGRFIADFFNA
jgi:hypothetical protein